MAMRREEKKKQAEDINIFIHLYINGVRDKFKDGKKVKGLPVMYFDFVGCSVILLVLQ